jgi:hypothetical protein
MEQRDALAGYTLFSIATEMWCSACRGAVQPGWRLKGDRSERKSNLQRRGTVRPEWRTVWSTVPVWFRLNQFGLTEISIWTTRPCGWLWPDYSCVTSNTTAWNSIIQKSSFQRSRGPHSSNCAIFGFREKHLPPSQFAADGNLRLEIWIKEIWHCIKK